MHLETASLADLYARLEELRAIRRTDKRREAAKVEIAAIVDEIDDRTFDWSEADAA